MVPASSVSTSVRSVFTPEVSSHTRVHSDRSRPDAASSSVMRSGSSVLPHACWAMYARTPAMKFSWPTQATSWRSTEAPLA